jgi:UDP-GlcNAc3NAcA epimerase
VPVIFPAHPRTSHLHPGLVRSTGGLTVIEPVDFLTMLAMIRDASCIITDSGGVQKEAYLLNTPCVTVREVTEWPETVEAGANVLVEPDPAGILGAFEEMSGRTGFGPGNPFGDGNAGDRIAEYIEENILPKIHSRA